MLLCPRCTTELATERSDEGTTYACAACHGRAATMPVLRKMLLPEVVNGLWLKARASKQRSNRPCPSCHDAMAGLRISIDGIDTAIDACERCQMVWFDAGELEVLPAKPPPPPPERLSPKAAAAYGELVAARTTSRIDNDVDPWDVRAIAGVPTKRGVPEATTRPFVTWAIATAMLGLYFVPVFRHGLMYALDHGQDEIHRLALEWGFIPNDPGRHGGLTSFTSFFLHGGAIHVIFNTYFLVLTGEDLENVMGRVKFVLLIAASTLLGDLVHMAMNRSSDIPCIGASGGISGLFAYYAFALPEVELGLAFGSLRWVGWGFTRVHLRVGWVFGIWFVLELLATRNTIGSVAHGAHVGGALAGVAWWAAERQLRRAKAPAG